MLNGIKIIVFIAVGSGLGGVARYGLSRLAAVIPSLASFWGTMAANVIGCFLIGLLYGYFDRNDIAEHWRLFLTVGFCGGFTTFSTFVNENYMHLTEGRFVQMLLYATGSFLLGLLMVHAGHAITR